MDRKYISFGKGYENTACIVINNIQIFNIDFLKIQEKTNSDETEKVACNM